MIEEQLKQMAERAAAGVTITRDDAIRIISLVACAENESLANLEDYELAKRLIEHFNIPDENRMLNAYTQEVERRKNYKPPEPPPALDLSLAADIPGLIYNTPASAKAAAQAGKWPWLAEQMQ
jgi:hypothetical protein